MWLWIVQFESNICEEKDHSITRSCVDWSNLAWKLNGLGMSWPVFASCQRFQSWVNGSRSKFVWFKINVVKREKEERKLCAWESKEKQGFFLVVRHMQEKIKLRGGVLGATTTESCIIIFKVIRILGVFFVIFLERRYYYTWCASQVRHKLKIYYNWLYNSRFI